jgi:hypothetical protein
MEQERHDSSAVPVPSSPPPAYLQGPPQYAPDDDDDATDPEKGVSAAPPTYTNRKRKVIILLAVSLILIVIIISVAVTGSMKQKKRTKDNNTGTSHLTLPGSVTPTTPEEHEPVFTSPFGVATNDCENLHGFFKVPVSNTSAIFDTKCRTTIQPDVMAEAGDVVVKTVNSTTALSFEQCMGYCALWNSAVRREAPLCMAVTYNANLTEGIKGDVKGNCALKDGWPKSPVNVFVSELVASARLRTGDQSAKNGGNDVDEKVDG